MASRSTRRFFACLLACSALLFGPTTCCAAQAHSISQAAYKLLNQRTSANRSSFYVYLDQDSGFNHGFPSGFFANSTANLNTIHIDAGCVDDPSASNGCSTSANALDKKGGTVFRLTFDPQAMGDFAGVQIEEPEHYGSLLGQGLPTGNSYNLTNVKKVIFYARSPDNASVQFGVGGCVGKFTKISSKWKKISLRLNTLRAPPGENPPPPCPPDIQHVHVLFSVGVNDMHGKNGATVLLDDIQFTPVPADLANVLSFPLGNQTFGVVPLQIGDPPPIAFPADQVLRNLTTTYESAITLIALLARAKNGDVAHALEIVNAFDYALHNDNQGDPIPLASDGSAGLHNGYENGDLPLLNNQSPPGMGHAGNSRLAGFTATQECPATGFCLVLDGATGGNNAFAILALLAAFQRSKNTSYLNDAVEIGDWIVRNLTDSGSNGYGGYFLGYPDQGVPPKPLLTGKSTENNADIFAAFTALASVEAELGSAAAANWAAEANRAGDFVMAMFDSTKGRFNVGTVPAGTLSGPGICPTGTQKGNDVINTCDFLDTDTFTTLAMAGAPRYSSQIDWRQPIQYVLKTFAQSVSAAGRNYSGFNIVPTPASGRNGVAWEFTGQTVAAMKYVDHLYAQTAFESSASFYLSQIRKAQKFAPFEDGEGLVASTLAGGDQLSPLDQCLNTPFQCIAERSGSAATVWAIFADRSLNPFLFQAANAK